MAEFPGRMADSSGGVVAMPVAWQLFLAVRQLPPATRENRSSTPGHHPTMRQNHSTARFLVKNTPKMAKTAYFNLHNTTTVKKPQLCQN